MGKIAGVTYVRLLHGPGRRAPVPEFDGYLEGAIRAAERVVAEVSAEPTLS